MKVNRQKEIISLLNEFDIETQEQLSAKLRERGFRVTQATVSRDIREMNLIKIIGADGCYKYAIPKEDTGTVSLKYKNLLIETVLSVDCADNIAVVKTCTGMAQGAAAAIDSFGRKDVLGSVAGDDTIIIVTRSSESAVSLVEALKKIIGD